MFAEMKPGLGTFLLKRKAAHALIRGWDVVFF
jgi:hypothetical protein